MQRNDGNMVLTDREQRSDHDLLIRLESKMDGLAEGVLEIKAGTTSKLAELDARVRFQEEKNKEIDLKELLKTVMTIERRLQGFDIARRTIFVLIGAIGAVMGFLLSTASGINNLIRH